LPLIAFAKYCDREPSKSHSRKRFGKDRGTQKGPAHFSTRRKRILKRDRNGQNKQSAQDQNGGVFSHTAFILSRGA
jgi:hypothetical protein